MGILTDDERAALAAYTPAPERVAAVNAALLKHTTTPDPKGPPYLLNEAGEVADPRDPLAQPMGGAWDGGCMHGIPTKRVNRTVAPDAGWVVEMVGKCTRCPPGVIGYFKPEPKPGQ